MIERFFLDGLKTSRLAGYGGEKSQCFHSLELNTNSVSQQWVYTMLRSSSVYHIGHFRDIAQS